MNFNINEYINGIFSGVVFFVYNYVQTLALLLWKPIGSAVRMAGRSRYEATSQINAYVFLYVNSLALIILLDFDVAMVDISVKLLNPAQGRGVPVVVHDEMLKILKAFPTDRVFFHYLIPALFQVVFIDLSARLISAIALGRRRHRQFRNSLFRDVVLYNFGFAFVLVMCLSAMLVCMIEYDSYNVLVLVLALMLAYVYFFSRHIVPISLVFARKAFRPSLMRVSISTGFVSIGLAGVAIGYMAIGMSLTQKTTIDYSMYVPTVTKVECYVVEGPALRALVVIANNTEEPRIILSNSFEIILTIRSFNSTAKILATSFRQNYDAYVIGKDEKVWFYLEADDTKSISALMATEPKFTGPDDDCAVSTHSGRFEGNLFTDYSGSMTLTDRGKIYDRRKTYSGSLIPQQTK
jgi:hypothetical protein